MPMKTVRVLYSFAAGEYDILSHTFEIETCEETAQSLLTKFVDRFPYRHIDSASYRLINSFGEYLDPTSVLFETENESNDTYYVKCFDDDMRATLNFVVSKERPRDRVLACEVPAILVDEMKTVNYSEINHVKNFTETFSKIGHQMFRNEAGEDILCVYKSPHYFIAMACKSQQLNASCGHLYFHRVSPLNRFRVLKTLFFLVHSSYSRHVLWLGVPGCGKSFATSAILMELMSLVLTGQVTNILIRINGTVVRITKADESQQAEADTQAGADTQTGAETQARNPFAVEYLRWKGAAVRNIKDTFSAINHERETYNENVVSVLILDFSAGELDNMGSLLTAIYCRSVKILFVASVHDNSERLTELTKYNPSFLIEPFSTEEMELATIAQMDLDPHSAKWLHDKNGNLLSREAVIAECCRRQQIVGNSPRYVFCSPETYENRVKTIRSHKFTVSQAAELASMNTPLAPSVYSFFLVPVFKPFVTDSQFRLYKYAAKELYQRELSKCKTEHDRMACSEEFGVNSYYWAPLSNYTACHILFSCQSTTDVQILERLNLRSVAEGCMIKSLLTMTTFDTAVAEQFSVDQWDCFIDPGFRINLVGGGNNLTNMRISTAEVLAKLCCCYKEKIFPGNFLHKSANRMEPGVLYCSSEPITMNGYVYYIFTDKKPRQSHVLPAGQYHRIYLIQISSDPATQSFRLTDIQQIYNGLELSKDENVCFKLVIVYVTDWRVAKQHGLAFEHHDDNNVMSTYTLLELQRRPSSLPVLALHDLPNWKPTVDRMESMVIRACFYPNIGNKIPANDKVDVRLRADSYASFYVDKYVTNVSAPTTAVTTSAPEESGEPVVQPEEQTAAAPTLSTRKRGRPAKIAVVAAASTGEQTSSKKGKLVNGVSSAIEPGARAMVAPQGKARKRIDMDRDVDAILASVKQNMGY